MRNGYNPTIFCGVPTLFAAMLNDDAIQERAKVSRKAAHLHIRGRSAAGIGRQEPGSSVSVSTSSMASARPSCCTSSCPTAPNDIKYGSSGRPVPGYRGAARQRCGRRRCPMAKSASCWSMRRRPAEGYWNQRSKEPSDLRGRLDPHRRQIHARCRRPLHVLRPRRRHVQGLRHLGLAVRGRERADHASCGRSKPP